MTGRRKHFRTLTGMALAGALVATAAEAETLTNTSGARLTILNGGVKGVGNVGPDEILMTGVNSGEQHRSAIVFDVPAGPNIVAASLSINSNGQTGGPNTLVLKELTTPIATVLGSVFTDALWDDLADGKIYGVAQGVNSDLVPIKVIFNADGLAALNAARGGRIAIGLINNKIDADPDYIFASAAVGPRELNLSRFATPVPTMSEWAMIILTGLLAAAGALWVARRRTASLI